MAGIRKGSSQLKGGVAEMASHMYEGVKSWNPFVGCRFGCVYCKRSFQRQAKRWRKWCEKCYNYEPHFHPEKLKRMPSAKTIFACAFGDIWWAKDKWIKQILETIAKRKDRTFYLQSKSPDVFARFVDKDLIPENVVLGTTIETSYEQFDYDKISQAPHPVERYETMRELSYLGYPCYVTIEPILDFDLEEMVEWIRCIKPKLVYVGYDNHGCKLPEPPLEKTLKLIEELRKFTEVQLKTIRKAWWEVEANAAQARV
jgi:DNA repair photolyase